MGVADEGEHIPSIIEDMDLEDEELEEGLADGDSSDEEGNAAVPAEWRDQEFSKLVVSEADQTPWQYHENKVSQGAMYPTKEAVIDAVKFWSLSLRRQFKVVKSSKREYDVKCFVPQCSW